MGTLVASIALCLTGMVVALHKEQAGPCGITDRPRHVPGVGIDVYPRLLTATCAL